MALQIYNTLTRKKEPFETIEPGVVRMYVCGVTVYDHAHIGHAMSCLVFDTIRRYLEHRGYTVRFVQNFTDVDDKVIAKSNEEALSPFEVADRYAREFLIEQEEMGIKPADICPRVSSEIPTIIEMVQTLVDKGHAYVAPNGDVYYSVKSFPEYGKLSRQNLEEAVSQEVSPNGKRDPLDFAVWKAAKPGEPWWDSPWGRGRPGWHIECSAMSMRHLGEQIDIHGGGTDLIFPHHENEIAQSEAACGCKPFARYWIHNGMLQLGDEKMSKSLGNIVPVGDFIAEHDPEAFRLFILLSHYRRPVMLSDDSIAAAEGGLERLRRAMRPSRGGIGQPTQEDVAVLAEAAEVADAEFHRSMDDDFGTPGALAALFELVTAINTARAAGVTGDEFDAAQGKLADLAGVLGFGLREGYGAMAGAGEQAEATPFIDLLVELRTEARESKDWALADRIRDALAERGVQLEDTPTGTEWYAE